MRTIGTQVRGIRAPIIKEGDDLVGVVVSSLKKSWQNDNYQLRDKDVVGITESLLARAQGNYVTVDDIAEEIASKYSGEIGVVFPILSRNRFSMILKAIARSMDKVYLQLSYPDDEVGNSLIDVEAMEAQGINPHTEIIDEEQYRKYFSDFRHPFTGLNYVKYYKEVAKAADTEIILANDPCAILDYTEEVLLADVHTRFRNKKIIKNAGAKTVYALDDICNGEFKNKRNSGGYNPEYGLLGSNKASDEKLKLFPRDGETFVNQVKEELKNLTGKNVEVMIYGDGAFKDPVGKIWELADPVVSPAYTSGLEGTPNEVKLKYLADNDLKNLDDEDLLTAMKKEIKSKEDNLVGKEKAQGTTPRQLTDLLGSLCDLVSGSGDKGTPIILVQGYFDSLAVD